MKVLSLLTLANDHYGLIARHPVLRARQVARKRSREYW